MKIAQFSNPGTVRSLPSPVQPPQVPATPEPAEQFTPSPTPAGAGLGQKLISKAKTLGLAVLDVAKYGALFGAQAAAGAYLGGPGVALAMAGAGTGYALFGRSAGEDALTCVKIGTAGSLVGAMAGVTGLVGGPAGIAMWAALGATGATISKLAQWQEGN